MCSRSNATTQLHAASLPSHCDRKQFSSTRSPSSPIEQRQQVTRVPWSIHHEDAGSTTPSSTNQAVSNRRWLINARVVALLYPEPRTHTNQLRSKKALCRLCSLALCTCNRSVANVLYVYSCSSVRSVGNDIHEFPLELCQFSLS